MDDVMPPEYKRAGHWYTWVLTPAIDVLEKAASSIDSLFSAQDDARASLLESHPWFYRLGTAERNEFFDYCSELDLIHEELDFVLSEFDLGIDSFQPEELYLGRLRLLYHGDNADFRVHAYREKVFKLVNYCLHLNISHAGLGKLKFNEAISNALERRRFYEVGRLLSQLSLDRTVSQAMVRRTLLTHKLAMRDSLMASRRRVEENIAEVGGVELVERLVGLEGWRKKKRKEIDAVCARLADFRFELVAALKKAASKGG